MQELLSTQLSAFIPTMAGDITDDQLNRTPSYSDPNLNISYQSGEVLKRQMRGYLRQAKVAEENFFVVGRKLLVCFGIGIL
jgi:hypothetical protein